MRKLVFASVLMLAACGQEPEYDAASLPMFNQAPIPKTIAELDAKIGNYASDTMTPDQFPDTFARLGEAKFNKANAMAKWARAVAAESLFCDNVEIGGTSDRATRQGIVWFIDCRNGARFYVNEFEADAAQQRWANGKANITHPARPTKWNPA